MAWDIITIDDLKKKMADAEYAAITTASLPGGVTGTMAVNEEISNGVALVRGYVAAYASNVLGEGETVPDELRTATLIIIRHTVFTRLPRMKQFLDDLRVREYEEAMRQARDAASGKFRVVSPEVPSTSQAGGSTIQVVSKVKRRASRQNTEGLL